MSHPLLISHGYTRERYRAVRRAYRILASSIARPRWAVWHTACDVLSQGQFTDLSELAYRWPLEDKPLSLRLEEFKAHRRRTAEPVEPEFSDAELFGSFLYDEDGRDI